MKELISLAMDSMEIAVTLIDINGTILYYNSHAAKILDRKPEYIGVDAHSHHREATSNQKFDMMLSEFENGRRESFHYRANPYGKPILVAVAPFHENGKFVGCVQTAQLQEDVESNYA